MDQGVVWGPACGHFLVTYLILVEMMKGSGNYA